MARGGNRLDGASAGGQNADTKIYCYCSVVASWTRNAAAGSLKEKREKKKTFVTLCDRHAHRARAELGTLVFREFTAARDYITYNNNIYMYT